MSYQRLPVDSEEKRYARVELLNIQVTGEPQPQYVPITQNQLPAGYTDVQIVVPQPQVVVVPPAPTPEQLRATLHTRRVEFNTCKYLSEGWTFTRYNCCTFFLILLTWGAIFFLVQIGSVLIVRGATGPWPTDPTNDGQTNLTDVVYRFQSHAYQAHAVWHRFTEGGGVGTGVGSDVAGSDVSGSDAGSDAMDFGEMMPPQARIALTIIMVAQQILLLTPMLASLFAATFKAMRDNARLKWKDSFMCFRCSYYRKLMPLTILLLLGRFVGFHLFVLPGVLFTFFTMFAIPLHHQFRHLSGWDAIKHSCWVVRRHFCSLAGFVIVLSLINFGGFFFVLIGLFFTIPLTFFSFCYCYHHLVGVNGVAVMVPASSLTATAPPPPTSPTTHTPSPAPSPAPIPTPTPTPTPTPMQATQPAPTIQSHFAPTMSAAPVATPMYHPSAVIAVPAGPNTSSMTVAPAFYAPVYPTTQGNIQGGGDYSTRHYPGQYTS